jgi:hypothetical protein
MAIAEMAAALAARLPRSKKMNEKDAALQQARKGSMA